MTDFDHRIECDWRPELEVLLDHGRECGRNVMREVTEGEVRWVIADAKAWSGRCRLWYGFNPLPLYDEHEANPKLDMLRGYWRYRCPDYTTWFLEDFDGFDMVQQALPDPVTGVSEEFVANMIEAINASPRQWFRFESRALVVSPRVLDWLNSVGEITHEALYGGQVRHLARVTMVETPKRPRGADAVVAAARATKRSKVPLHIREKAARLDGRRR